MTLYEAATRVKPFDPLDEAEQEVASTRRYLQLCRPAPPITRWRRRLPAPFVSVVHACLDPDPDARPSVLGLWEALGAVLEDLGHSADGALEGSGSIASVGHQATGEERAHPSKLLGNPIHLAGELDRP